MIAAPRRPPAAITTSAARELAGAARRTLRLRLLLAVAAAGALAAAFVLVRSTNARATSYFATGAGGVVVLDLSTSVDPLKQQRVYRVLRTLTGTETRLGLVVFSDTAYEALPPGTRGEELKPLLRFFTPPPGPRSRAAPQVFRRFGITSPWSGAFRGGTRISTGLRQARLISERDRAASPSVLLVSDLDDSAFDTGPLTQELIRYERDGIELRIVPLFPNSDDREFFAQLAGEDAFLRRPELLRNSELEERQSLVADFPTPFVVAAGGLLLLLALNERACARLAWRRKA